MKVILLLVFFTFGSTANEIAQFDSYTLDKTQSIYWINNKTKSAVVYSEFENFYKLKEVVSTTLLSSTGKALTSYKHCTYDELVFVDNNKNIITKFRIKGNSIINNNYAYKAFEQKLIDFVEINRYRIQTENQINNKAIKYNIKNYSESCL